MSGSKGILEGLNKDSKKDKNLGSKEVENLGSKEVKNENSKEFKNLDSEEVKNLGIEELSIKRSYTLKPSTIKKLQELKVFLYDDPNITFNEIVDEAICFLYEKKKQ